MLAYYRQLVDAVAAAEIAAGRGWFRRTSTLAESIPIEEIERAVLASDVDGLLGRILGPGRAEWLAGVAAKETPPIAYGASRFALGQSREVMGFAVDEALLEAPIQSYLRRASADLVTGITAEQREALRAVLSIGELEPGFAPYATTRRVSELVRDSIGLTPRLSRALARRTAQVEEGIAAGIYSPGAGRAAIRQYQRRLESFRGEMIARTELQTASNEIRRLAWRASARAAGVGPHRYYRESVGILGSNICPYCHARHGTRAPIDGTYADGLMGPPWPHGGGGVTIGCRCGERLVRLEDPVDDAGPYMEPERRPALWVPPERLDQAT